METNKREFTVGKLPGPTKNYILDPDGYTILSAHNEKIIEWVLNVLNRHIDEYKHPIDKELKNGNS